MKNLYKVVFYTPYRETDTTYWVLAAKKDDIDPEDMEDLVRDNAKGFEYLATEFETEEDREDYYADCGYDIFGPYNLSEAIEEGYFGLADAEY